MFLAGDVGGTKTLLGLFAPAPERPTAVEVGEFVTLDYDGLEAMIREFLRSQNVSPRQIEVACFGVAGAVTDYVARLTNVPWLVDIRAVAERSGLSRCLLLNDLEALGYAIPVLLPDELAVLQQGVAAADGNAAVIAAGTGLGEALLHNVDGRFVPSASEGGHADFAPHSTREIRMLEALMKIFGHVSVEHVVSGPGLVNVYQFTHDAFGSAPSFTPSTVVPRKLCAGVGQVRDPADLPARISQSALERRCPLCMEAMEVFIEAYGAEAGNLALRYVATGGVYIGGGIAPKIMTAMESGPFLDAFSAKGLMRDLVATVPVSVILNDDAGLMGAAVHAIAATDVNQAPS
jgi:glucokinase